MADAEVAVTQARAAAHAVWQLLREQEVGHLVPGVEAILGELDAAPETISYEVAVSNAASLYRSMSGGMGSLNDVVLWIDGDPGETTRSNELLHANLRTLSAALLEPRVLGYRTDAETDLYAASDALATRLRDVGHAERGDRINEVVMGAATGTEALMGLARELERLLADEAGDAAIRADVRALLNDVSAFLYG